jgi:hypothetical protein
MSGLFADGFLQRWVSSEKQGVWILKEEEFILVFEEYFFI